MFPKRLIYENRYQVENSFLKLKGWSGIAMRYAKTTTSYKASVQICCVFMWLNIVIPAKKRQM